MDFTVLKTAYLNGKTCEPGEVVTLDDQELAARLVDRGTIIGADGAKKAVSPTPQPPQEATATEAPLVQEPELAPSESEVIGGSETQPEPTQQSPALKNVGVQPTPAQINKTVEALEQDSMPDVHIS